MGFSVMLWGAEKLVPLRYMGQNFERCTIGVQTWGKIKISEVLRATYLA